MSRSHDPAPASPNPDPRRFEIVREVRFGEAAVLEVRYEGVPTYEGRKILVFTDAAGVDFRGRAELDPHFCEHSHSPFARFEPTEMGWRMACAMADTAALRKGPRGGR